MDRVRYRYRHQHLLTEAIYEGVNCGKGKDTQGSSSLAQSRHDCSTASGRTHDRRSNPLNYALVVGVSRYQALSTLAGVVNDVREISALLVSNDAKGYSLTRLLDEDATKAAIEKQVANLLNVVEAGDTVIVFFAGHGGLVGDQAYFMPADFAGGSPNAQALSLQWLRDQFDHLPCDKALFLLDFCHSGGAIARSGQAAIKRALDIEGQGKVIISACTKVQTSHEDSESGHGWFTKAVLDGLRGAAVNGDGWVTINSLFAYVCKWVKDQGDRFTADQTPLMHGTHNGEVKLIHRQSQAEPRLAPPARLGPKLRRSDFEPLEAARELFDDLHQLILGQEATLQQGGIKLMILTDDKNEKVYVLRLANGKKLSLGLVIGSWGFESVSFRFGWNQNGFPLQGQSSANDIFRPEAKPGESEDWIACTIGAVVATKASLPKSKFIDAFWSFVCKQLESLDRH